VFYRYLDNEYVSGEFMQTFVIFEHVSSPRFFRADNGDLIMYNEAMDGTQSEFSRITLNDDDGSVFIEELHERPRATLTSLRMHDLEISITNLMEQRFGLNETPEEIFDAPINHFRANMPPFEMSEDHAKEIVRGRINRFNDIAYLFSGEVEVCEEEFVAIRNDIYSARYAFVADERISRLQSVDDIRALLNSVYTREGASIMHGMLEMDAPLFRDISGRLAKNSDEKLNRWPLLSAEIINDDVEILHFDDDRVIARVNIYRLEPGHLLPYEKMMLSFRPTEYGWVIDSQRIEYTPAEFPNNDDDMFRSFMPSPSQIEMPSQIEIDAAPIPLDDDMYRSFMPPTAMPELPSELTPFPPIAMPELHLEPGGVRLDFDGEVWTRTEEEISEREERMREREQQQLEREQRRLQEENDGR
jgi:hypothetical protein